MKEREILLRRFFNNDRKLYELGRATGIEWFDRFDHKFKRDTYAYFAREERGEAIRIIADPKEVSDERFISALNEVGSPEYLRIDRFVGEHYYFDLREDATFKLEDRTSKVREDIRGVLEDTKGRAYYFLKATIILYEVGRWDKAYGGAVWTDILARIRELGGAYPAPRDIAVIKSYRIYHKTGSRRYPTHTIPEETVPIVKEELKKWKQARLKR